MVATPKDQVVVVTWFAYKPALTYPLSYLSPQYQERLHTSTSSPTDHYTRLYRSFH